MNNPQTNDAGRQARPEYLDDEISLAELWNTLERRKYVILICLLAALLAAAAASLLTSPRYESRAVIAVGKAAGAVLEAPELLQQRLKHQYRVDDPDITPEPPYLSAVEVDTRGAKTVLTLAARGESPEQARDFLGGVVGQVLSEHNERYTRLRGLRQGRVDSLAEAIAQVEGQIALMADKIRSLGAHDASTAAILTVERGKLISELTHLKEQRTDLEFSLLPPNTEPTRLLLEPTLTESPERPRPVLYTALALVLGLFGGVVAAFVWEAAARVRREMDARQGED